MHGFEQMEANLRATLAVFARARPDGDARALAGVAAVSSGVNFAMFNSAVLTSAIVGRPDLEQRIQAAAVYFFSKGLPWSFWLCEHWIPRDLRSRLVDIFGASGLHLVVELPGMAADNLLPPAQPLPPIDCRPVGDQRTRAEFNHIMSVTFGIAFPISRQIYEAEATWGGDFIGYLGYLGETPVATAATVTAGGVTGVYAVATMPRFRRCGYAEAVVRHALKQAGAARSILQSSDAGYNLYLQMGYRKVARYAVFAYG